MRLTFKLNNNPLIVVVQDLVVEVGDDIVESLPRCRAPYAWIAEWHTVLPAHGSVFE